MRSSLRSIALLSVAMVVLVSCVDMDPYIETSYGTTNNDSINGFSTIHDYWEERFDLDAEPWLDGDLRDRDLLIHLARTSELPDNNTMSWISTWLHGHSKRQFVLVLRDGDLTEWLLERWIAETETNDGDQDQEKIDFLRSFLAKYETEYLRPDDHEDRFGSFRPSFFRITSIQQREAERVTGLFEGSAPDAFRIYHQLESSGDMTPLIRFDGQIWSGEVAFFSGGRLIVCVNALPMLDAGLVDDTNRAIVESLSDHILSRKPENGAWVQRLSTTRGDPPTATPDRENQARAILLRPPVSYLFWHILITMLVFIAWRADRIGRRVGLPQHRLQHFSSHVRTLADHLRRRNGFHYCTKAWNRYREQRDSIKHHKDQSS